MLVNVSKYNQVDIQIKDRISKADVYLLICDLTDAKGI